MSLILFIDDDAERHIAFRKRNPFALQTGNLAVAQHELNLGPGHITELWLDHDLGDVFVAGGFFDPETGRAVGSVPATVMPLVDWMCASSTVSRTLPVRIHSWNAPRAREMQYKLRDAGFVDVTLCPFSFAGNEP